MGGSKISIRTSLLDDKANACNMLCCYADELKEGFFPWVEQVTPPSLVELFLSCGQRPACTQSGQACRCGRLQPLHIQH